MNTLLYACQSIRDRPRTFEIGDQTCLYIYIDSGGGHLWKFVAKCDL